MPRIDYDAVAPLYDEPSRDHTVDRHLRAYLQDRDDCLRHRVRVLDIGCGTRKQLTANRGELLGSLQCVGVDRSHGMLRIAQRRARDVAWVQGDGVALPLRSNRFDYACCQFVHAHVADKGALIREAYRVLVPGGRLVQLNIDPWAMEDWVLYRYFPAAQLRDHADFVPAEQLISQMKAAGFRHARVTRDVRQEIVDLHEFLVLASARSRASQLTAISDLEYQQGLRLLAQGAGTPDAPVRERSVFCVATYTCEK